MNIETAINNLKAMEDNLASGSVSIYAKEFSLYQQSLNMVLEALESKNKEKENEPV